MLDRGFQLYTRLMPEHEGVAPGLFYPFKVHPQSDKQAALGAARMMANAARAAVAGLGTRPTAEPPPLYAFDPATGRLAVTTPHYNTAITAVTHGAYPYGGLDLARLYDGQQDVAATLGARVPSSFGVVVRNGHGTTRLVDGAPGQRSRGPAAAAAAARPRRASAPRARHCVRSRGRSSASR